MRAMYVCVSAKVCWFLSHFYTLNDGMADVLHHRLQHQHPMELSTSCPKASLLPAKRCDEQNIFYVHHARKVSMNEQNVYIYIHNIGTDVGVILLFSPVSTWFYTGIRQRK